MNESRSYEEREDLVRSAGGTESVVCKGRCSPAVLFPSAAQALLLLLPLVVLCRVAWVAQRAGAPVCAVEEMLPAL